MKSENLAFADFSSFVWKKNTLYHVHHDTEVTILSMLRQGKSTASIHGVLEQLLTDGAVTTDKHKDMVRLIQSMSGGLLDADPTNFKAKSQFIATGKANSSQVLSRDEAAVKLQEYEDKFLAIWDEETSTYLKHSEHTPSKQMPTQYLALQQLKKNDGKTRLHFSLLSQHERAMVEHSSSKHGLLTCAQRLINHSGLYWKLQESLLRTQSAT